jgi:hypothetical protein
VAALRTCVVSIRDAEGSTHSVTVHASTLFEAAAAAVAAFRQEEWAADALTPAAVLRVEVQVPSVVHEIRLKSVERWARSANASPQERLAKDRSGLGKGSLVAGDADR